jgi:glycosyltransferase involved in cell wall biosynthesis
MRVLFNAFTACRMRTGVGCYAANLLAALKRLAGNRVRAFPDGWLGRVATAGSSLLGKPRPADATHQAPKSLGLRLQMKGVAYSAARKLCEGGFRLASLRRDYDLYHEPNFIPWRCNIPAVVTVHDLSAILHPEWHPADRAAFHERHLERGLRDSAHVITDTECVRQEVIRLFGIHPNRVSAVHLGVRDDLRPMTDAETRPALARLNLDSPYLLYVGSIEPRKNLLMLMQAYCSLPDAVRARCPLVLAGPWGWNFAGVRSYYDSTARHRGVAHIGYVADADLSALYNGARALVYPSHYEGFGLPPLEMMACGGAVLASTAAAIRETCGDLACLVDPDDHDAWRDAMYRVAIDDDWRETLRAGAAAHAARFSWRQCAAETWDLYRMLTRPNQLSEPFTPAAKAA